MIVARRAAGPGHALRRPEGPQRRPRRLRGVTGRAGGDVRAGASRPPAGRSRSRPTSSWPCTGRTASTPIPTARAVPPDDGATSSPRRRSGRCSAPWSPASSTPSGSASTAPTRSRSSTPVPVPARWPAPCSPPARPARRPCTTSPSRCRRAQRARHPADVGVGRHVPGRAVHRRRRWPTSCSTTCRSASPSTTGAWREAYVTVGRDGALAEVLSAPFDPLPAVLPATPAHGARAPLQDAAATWLATARRRLVERGAVLVVDYARPSTAGDGRDPVARLAADLPRARAGAGARWSTPATRTSPSTSPSTSCRSPTLHAPSPSSSAGGGSTSWWPRAAGRGMRRPPRPTSPR